MKKTEPTGKYAKEVREKRDLHKARLLERFSDDHEEIPIESFNKAWKKIKSKPGRKYEFFKNAGNSLQEALFNLLRAVWKAEKIPSQWMEKLSL